MTDKPMNEAQAWASLTPQERATIRALQRQRGVGVVKKMPWEREGQRPVEGKGGSLAQAGKPQPQKYQKPKPKVDNGLAPKKKK